MDAYCISQHEMVKHFRAVTNEFRARINLESVSAWIQFSLISNPYIFV